MDTTFPHLISFTKSSGNELLNRIRNSTMDPNIILTQNCLCLLSSVLERNSPKQDNLSTHYSGTTSSRVSSIGSRLSRIESIASVQLNNDNLHVSSGGLEDGLLETGRGITRQPSLVNPSSLNDPSASEIPAEDGDDLLSECSDIEAQILHNQQYQTTAMFLFALIWSFGAYISYSKIREFSDLIHDLATKLPAGGNMIPTEGLVFDYYLDLKTHRFFLWSEKKREKSSSSRQHQYVTVPELERYAYITDLYLSYGYNVVLIGDQGCGKTSFLKNMIQSRVACTNLPVTHTLTSSSFLSSIANRLSQLKKRQGGSTRKTLSQKSIFLLDDLHLANNIVIHGRNNVRNENFTYENFVPVTEAVSMIAEQRNLPDLFRDYVHTLKGVRLLVTSTPVGTRKFSLKLLRQLNAVPFFPLSNDSLNCIVQKKLSSWTHRLALESDDSNEALVRSLSVASVSVFRNVTSRFSPSASNPHFLFNLHDLAAVWDGMQLMSSNKSGWQGGGGGMGMMGRRGLLRHRETQSKQRPPAGRTTASKTKSGKAISRRGNQTGRGIKTLPSLSESTKQSRPRLHRQETLPSGLDKMMQRGPMYKDQQKTLSTSLPADLRNRGSRTSNEKEEKEKYLGLLRGVMRLWCHEVSRVYGDRLYTSKDKIWFVKLIETCCKYCFCGAEVEEATDTQLSVNAGGRRARPGRLSRGGATGQGMNGHVDVVNVPGMRLQAADLTVNGILYHMMRDILPKDKQVELLKYEELTVRGEDLSSLMFAKLPTCAPSDDQKQSLDYSEIGDGQVKDAISEVLDKQKETSDIGHVVMNKQAMEHVIKLCRALVIPGTHCLLLGQRGVGRKTSTKFAAKLLNATVYELNCAKAEQSHSVLREACMSAGVEKEKVVLLVDAVSESSTCGYWDLVIEMMREGLAMNLFTSSEILIMSNKINPEKLRRTNESAFQGFAEAIRSNLHVVITWDMSNDTHCEVFSIKTFDSSVKQSDWRYILEDWWQNLFRTLLKSCSYINHYQLWNKEAYSEIALQLWENKQFSKTAAIGSSDLEALSYLAAHIHLTSTEVLRQALPTHYQWMVTPRDYVQYLRTGLMLYEDLKSKGEDKVQKLHSSLSHLYALERQVSNLREKLESDLQPRLESAESDVAHHKGLITAAKERYMASSDRCKKAEETIERETEQVKKFKQLVETKFLEVSPTYNSALEALSSVERTVVMEIMGYRSPPSHLLPVFEGLCLLFDRPPTWEDCQQLMLSQHFYESLRFFDKDSVPKKKLDKLEKLLADQKKISLSRVAEVSQAVVPLVLWIAALVDYKKAKAAVQPYRDQLSKAEETLTCAQEVYITMRQDMLATKAALEVQHVQHKEAVKKFKAIEADFEAVQAKMDSIQKLLDCLSNQKRNWEHKLSDTQQHLDCLPAESLLTVAMATYCSSLPPKICDKLWKNWIGYCYGMVSPGSLSNETVRLHDVNIRVEDGFFVQNVLAEVDELLAWERREVFSETVLLEKALLWRMRTKYCQLFVQVVFDPNNMASQYIEELYRADEEGVVEDGLVCLVSDDSGLARKLAHCAAEGSRTVFLIQSLADVDQLYPILQPLMLWSYNYSHNSTLILNGHKVTLHHNFQLYIVLPLHISHQHTLVSFILHNSALEQVTNLELSQDGLSMLFHRHIIQASRRELCIQQRALLADLKMHKRGVIESEEAIMSCIGKIDWSNEQSSENTEILMKTIQDTEAKQSTSLNRSMDTQQALQDITKHTAPYKKLADHFAVLYQSCQQLSIVYPQVSTSLEQIIRLLADMLHQHDNTRFHWSQSSLGAYLLHLEHASTLEIYNRIAPSLFTDQQLLFPLSVCLNKTLQKLDVGLQKLLLYPQPLPILELLESSVSDSSTVHCHLDALERFENLKNLTHSMKENGGQWKEYFNAHPSLLLPLPQSEGQFSVSLAEKLILWKLFQPGKFKEAVQSYVSLFLGPEFATAPVTPALISTNTLPTLCVYNEECFSVTEKLLPCFDHEQNVIIISAFDDDLENEIHKLMAGQHIVIVDHVSMPLEWIENLTRILKVHSLLKFCPSAQLYLPVPAKRLNQLTYHLHSYPCRIVSLPNNESIPLLRDYHQLHGTSNVTLQNVEYLCRIVNKLSHSSIAKNVHNYFTCQDPHVWSDLQLLAEYLTGKETYSAHIGYLLTCIVNNSCPELWQVGIGNFNLVDCFI